MNNAAIIWETAFAVIASVGGAGVIIGFIGKWLAGHIAERMLKQKEFELSRQLEGVKSTLEKKIYISKTRFDLEIEIYRSLSEKVFQMVVNQARLFPAKIWGDEQKKRMEIDEDVLLKALSSYEAANNEIFRNTAFIPKEIYESFNDIRKLCYIQLDEYYHFASNFSAANDVTIKEFKDSNPQCYQRTIEINDDMKRLFEELRTYLASLDVIEK